MHRSCVRIRVGSAVVLLRTALEALQGSGPREPREAPEGLVSDALELLEEVFEALGHSGTEIEQ